VEKDLISKDVISCYQTDYNSFTTTMIFLCILLKDNLLSCEIETNIGQWSARKYLAEEGELFFR